MTLRMVEVERPRESAYISAYVPAGLREELAELTHARERSLSGELRVAIARHLEANRVQSSGDAES